MDRNEITVLAAKYKAERDLARQEADRASHMVDSYRNVLNGICKRLGITDGTDLPEMDSIIYAELDNRVISSDDADWLKEYGGFDGVRDSLSNDNAIILTVINALWPNGVSENGADNDEIAEELKCRLMPPGYEWPRFDDEKQVECSNEFVDGSNNTRCVMSVEIIHNVDGKDDVNDALIHWSDTDPLDAVLVCMWQGERVKRPKPDPIGADGLPIKKGDTVWHKNGLASGVVSSVDYDSLMRTVRYISSDGTEFRDAAKDITHTKPEPPDSWERLEEDARELDISLDGENTSNYPRMSCVRDLVRRAKALAEKEVKVNTENGN